MREQRQEKLWAIVPLKSFAQGKSRLSKGACQAEREAFNLHCASHVLGVIQNCSAVDEVLIATNDDFVMNWSSGHALHCIRDREESSLNDTLNQSLAFAELNGAGTAIILFADLPFLDVASLGVLVDLLEHSDCVLAPDRRSEGTNALGIRFPGKLDLHFEEPTSFKRHREACVRAQLSTRIVERFDLGFDVDLPVDFEEFKSLSGWTAPASKSVS